MGRKRNDPIDSEEHGRSKEVTFRQSRIVMQILVWFDPQPIHDTSLHEKNQIICHEFEKVTIESQLCRSKVQHKGIIDENV